MEKKKLSLPAQIFIALLLGIVVGLAFYFMGKPEITTNYLKPFGTIFVNLLKFIVVPVVLLSMIDGIVSMGDMKKVGSVGWKTVAYFLVTTAIACVIGLVFANIFNNAGLFPTLQLVDGQVWEKATSANFMDTLIGIFPSNLWESFRTSNMLQVIVIAILLGGGILTAGEKGKLAQGDRGTHLGRHLIQSFAVGETTPEEAHKIGMELAGAVLGGKYEFVLTTHVDKDHLHNHLIFNAVSFVDYKKYHSNKQSYHFIRRTSDRICKEHGLSVVVPGQDKGKSYAEYTAEKQGTSYKAKLKTAIDTLIPQVKDFDELLRRLQEMGYEIKQGKYISFRAAGQERFTRTKTLGAAYTEEAIKERIKGVYVAKTKTLREDKKIRLVVDLENSIKAQQSAGYERWAKIHNLKQAAKSMNFLTENKIEYYSELESKIADIMTAHDAAAKAVKEVEQRMSDLPECYRRVNRHFSLLYLPLLERLSKPRTETGKDGQKGAGEKNGSNGADRSHSEGT